MGEAYLFLVTSAFNGIPPEMKDQFKEAIGAIRIMLNNAPAMDGIEYDGMFFDEITIRPKDFVDRIIPVDLDVLSDAAIEEAFLSTRDDLVVEPFLYLNCGDIQHTWDFFYATELVTVPEFFDEVVEWITQCEVDNKYLDVIMENM